MIKTTWTDEHGTPRDGELVDTVKGLHPAMGCDVIAYLIRTPAIEDHNSEYWTLELVAKGKTQEVRVTEEQGRSRVAQLRAMLN